jgi:hypothetical protein
VALTFAGNAVTGHQRDRRAARDARDAAIAELLAASIDLVQAVNVIRSRWKHQTAWRARMLIAAALMRDIPDVSSWKDVTDRSLLRRLLGSVRDLAREQDEAAPTFTLDYSATVAPKTSRFYVAVTALTLGAMTRSLPPPASSNKQVPTSSRQQASGTGNRPMCVAGSRRSSARSGPWPTGAGSGY